MNKSRLEAFSDGVIAILITIMVLELKVPHSSNWEALREISPVFLSYVLSFIYIGIYWNNHHHLFMVVSKINGAVMWANLHLLFWLSLIPFLTGWMGENHFASLPVALYGAVLLMNGVAFSILSRALMGVKDANSTLYEAFGDDFKGKISVVLYALAIPLSFPARWLSLAIYASVAVIWFLPDPRIEKRTARAE